MAPIEVTDLTKRYGDGGVVAIDSLSFSVEEGEVFGFLGPNGAGKTTTIRTLLGLLSPTEGTAQVLGADIRDEAALIEAKRRIGYLPADLGFDEGMTGEQVLDHHAAIKGGERREELLELFTPPVEREIREYSTGNEQMLGIVQAFMHDPDLVIMDEPTSGLDPLKQEAFHAFLETERERGTTVFFSSHVLSDVRRICDRIAILREGRLVALEDVETLLDRGGKRVRVRLADDPDEAFLTDGMLDRRMSDSTVTFTYVGEYNALLNHLANYDVLDVEIKEPPLEDVFMHYYGEDTVPERDSSTPHAEALDA
ncbi:ABC transporter ATP-binding protein [Halalkalicoccus jeotgali]|uniref:ABC transporter related protein n=1 Tax=Halalkalicoccus jeotgali (strain DSM 18796 / CECT 7217 / JCM 14584 / KCTC 4019 / B3) TaxID=795797 RepID=D8J2P3_HALJB|nr:ABC transporter ATP-binding protein [Halalkalicoccus jeotgali]ADJ15000.1 ABC transporter related protein [Halalkalicoccus jeotgali B3]ELY34984.1 ABC transporter-like protein [Halalkalicoccus jeotgali B3]